MQYIPKCPLIEKIMGFGVVPFADKAMNVSPKKDRKAKSHEDNE